jgi:MYXO-CTERM domain-containing protein
MRTITLFLFAALVVTSVDAASYQKNDGTIVDPILDNNGNVLSYSGPNFEPSANLFEAETYAANLNHADLGFATLTYAYLYEANLTGATLIHADLQGAILIHADLTNADLSNANLHYADFTKSILTGANFAGATDPPSTSSQLALTPLDETIIGGAQLHYANFSGADISGVNFTSPPPDSLDATGWETATWTGAHFDYLNPALFPTGMIYTDHGIVVRTPEPSTLLLALFGLALLPRRRRR